MCQFSALSESLCQGPGLFALTLNDLSGQKSLLSISGNTNVCLSWARHKGHFHACFPSTVSCSFHFFPPKVSQWEGSAKAQSENRKVSSLGQMCSGSSPRPDDWQKHGTQLGLQKYHCCVRPRRQEQGGIAHFASFLTWPHSKDLLGVWDQLCAPASITGMGRAMFLFHTLVSSSLRNFSTMLLFPD